MYYENSEINKSFETLKTNCESVMDFLRRELSTIRAGRANPRILDRVTIDYYGARTPLQHMANISVPDARTLLISLWDTSKIREVVKAINEVDATLNPSDDGKAIRIIFPLLNEERRKELVKNVRKETENAKVGVRNHRRDCLEMLKRIKKDSNISEDMMSSVEDDVQRIVDSYNIMIEKITADKEKEILEI
jgi:ribosome recycling factor